MAAILIADSGSTKTDWCLLQNGKVKKIATEGLSPYFLSTDQIYDVVENKVKKKLKDTEVAEIFFYGAGCSNPGNVKSVKQAIRKSFKDAKVAVDHDLMGAAKALCGHEKGVACILGTGSNSCYYNGKSIVKNNPGLGYVLGDEGSGSYLGKKVIQYFLYNTFDEDLRVRFIQKYETDQAGILNAVYKEPLPNKYLAKFTLFLSENRGHYMIENILEDGLSDFIYNHIYKYAESWKMPIHFTGSVAFAFKDVLKDLLEVHQLEIGSILKSPMEGLIKYHSS